MSTRAVFPNRPTDEMIAKAKRVLGLTHGEFGEAIGMSERTSQRWSSRRAAPTISQLCTLAALVYPRDVGLASLLAQAASETLESLGIVTPPPPVAQVAPLAPHLVADLVVCAAADAGGITPAAARAAVRALFVRMREMGLSVEDVEGVLAPPGT